VAALATDGPKGFGVEAEYETVSLGYYFGVLWRGKWTVLLALILMTAAAGLYVRRQHTLYSATAQVIATNPSSTGKSSAPTTWAQDNQPLANQPSVAKQVLHKLKLTGRNPFQLATQVTATSNVAGNGLLLTVSDPNPKLAPELANAFASVLGSYAQSRQLTNVQTLLKKATERLASDYAKLIPSPSGSASHATLKSVVANDTQTQNVLDREQTALTSQTTQVVPTSSSTQTQPKISVYVATGAGLGLVIGVILAFVWDLIDTRVRSANDAGQRLQLPLLANVPAPAKDAGSVVMLDPSTSRNRPSAEAYRVLELNLTAALGRHGVRTVMLTAAGQNEGTTTVAANLATVLVRSGMHVVLVDANLRVPNQNTLFGIGESRGLSDVLSGDANLRDVLRTVDVRQSGHAPVVVDGSRPSNGLLEVLPAGTVPPDSADLLHSRTATELIGRFRDRADVVIIDAPAALSTTDAMILATKVDGLIVVARHKLATEPDLVALRRAVTTAPAVALGFVYVGTSPNERIDFGGEYALPVAAPPKSS
jgi:capsular exopolysaccharide synthesis family protein